MICVQIIYYLRFLKESEKLNKTIIGIKFKEAGKIYFFDPKGEKLKKGD